MFLVNIVVFTAKPHFYRKTPLLPSNPTFTVKPHTPKPPNPKPPNPNNPKPLNPQIPKKG